MSGYKGIVPRKEHQWKKGQSGNPNGRPKKIYSVLKETGYSKDDIFTIFEEMLFYTIAELKAVVKDKNSPAIVVLVASAIKKGIENGEYNRIREIVYQLIGKPEQKQQVDVTTQGERLPVTILQLDSERIENDEFK